MTNNCQSGKLLLVGFSARALAEAARSSCRELHAVDHFGDADLQELVDSWQTLPWRGGKGGPQSQAQANQIVGAIARDLGIVRSSAAPRLPVLLAGGMENWPELLHALSARFKVLGPSCDQLSHLRDPRCLADLARPSGLKFPDTVFTFSQVQPATQSWLAKALDGSGGLAVHRVPTLGTQPFRPSAPGTQPALGTQPGAGPSETRPTMGTQPFSDAVDAAGTQPLLAQPLLAPLQGGAASVGQRNDGTTPAEAQPGGGSGTTYWQRWLAGRSLGITCILKADASVQLLGATESWDAHDWPGPAEFIYRGSWGPVELSTSQQRAIREFAVAVQRKTGLRGWLQMDCLEQPDGELALLEVNPRWTAGMELLHLSGMRPVDRHLGAWGLGGGPQKIRDQLPGRLRQMYGKAVVYARQTVEVTAELRGALGQLPKGELADLPAKLGPIPAGHPLLTVRTRRSWAAAASWPRSAIRAALLSQLQQQVERISQLL